MSDRLSSFPWLVVLLGAMALSCQLAVGDDLGTVRCRQEGVVGPPACARGHSCQQGVCVACAAMEFCGDGVDNNCNGQSDEACEAPLDAGTESAVDAEPGDVSMEAADADDAADVSVDEPAVEDVVQEPDAQEPVMGKACGNDAHCGQGYVCRDWLEGQGSLRCTMHCCRSEDCPDGAVCASAYGGNLCVVASELGLSGLGTAREGAACTGNGACRSGRCVNDRCSDVCCRDYECKNSACSLLSSPFGKDGRSWQCVPAATASGGGWSQLCSADGDCKANWCVGVTCTQACCSSAECPAIPFVGNTACDYDITDDKVAARGCIVPRGGGGVAGAACSAHNNCMSGYCMPEGYCTDVCCTDDNCDAPLRCLPHLESYLTWSGTKDVWVLRCLRP